MYVIPTVSDRLQQQEDEVDFLSPNCLSSHQYLFIEIYVTYTRRKRSTAMQIEGCRSLPSSIILR